MAMQDNQEAIEALQFPKVMVQRGIEQNPGYLTEVSAKILLVELERCGFVLTRRTDAATIHPFG